MTRTHGLDERRKALHDFKVEQGCARCGYNRCGAALHFHHRDASEKQRSISRAISYTWEEVKHEIEACDILCSNCHIEEHHLQLEPLEPRSCEGLALIHLEQIMRCKPVSRLTSDQVKSIRHRSSENKSKLAGEFGVSRKCIYNVLHRRNYRSVT